MKFTEENIRAIFGNEAAEDEELKRLREYYMKGSTYEQMNSRLPLYILVGHKGTGKSALLNVLESEDLEKGNIVISIQPDDIIGVNNLEDDFQELIRGWKNGLANIIFEKMIESLKAKNNEKWSKKVLNIITSIVGKKLSELQKEYINISFKDFAKIIKNEIFTEKSITIYIDDLDRGWKNTKKDIANISALLNAARDLSRELKNLRFRIALRSDVYYSVRTSDESTDKIESSVLWNSWTNHEILVMLIKRIETFLGNDVNENELLVMKQRDLMRYLLPVFEERFEGKGHWENAPMYRVLMSLIRKRPRDLIKLCTMAARRAKICEHEKITTEDLEKVFNEYSNGRLQDTVNEYASEFPQLENLLLNMKPTRKEIQEGVSSLFTRDQLIIKLKNICGRSNFCFSNGKNATPVQLAAFLYKINFLSARKDFETDKQRIYYDENKYLINDFTDFGYKYEIHPAYRWALQPDDIMSLYKQIELSEE